MLLLISKGNTYPIDGGLLLPGSESAFTTVPPGANGSLATAGVSF